MVGPRHMGSVGSVTGQRGVHYAVLEGQSPDLDRLEKGGRLLCTSHANVGEEPLYDSELNRCPSYAVLAPRHHGESYIPMMCTADLSHRISVPSR